jgi:hypothetical protein
MPPPTTTKMAGIVNFLKRVAGSIAPTRLRRQNGPATPHGPVRDAGPGTIEQPLSAVAIWQALMMPLCK